MSEGVGGLPQDPDSHKLQCTDLGADTWLTAAHLLSKVKINQNSSIFIGMAWICDYDIIFRDVSV